MKESILVRLINEAIVNVLNEGVGGNYLYHFTNIPEIISIMESGCIMLEQNDLVFARYTNSWNRFTNYPFYLSLTRSKMGNEGYSRGSNVRITLNADKLRNIRNVKIGPIDYWQGGYSKDTKKYLFDKSLSNYERNQYEDLDEREDRLISNRRVLDISGAIERIDVYIYDKEIEPENDNYTRIDMGGLLGDFKLWHMFKDVIGKYVTKTYFYKDKASFDSQNNEKAINWHYLEFSAKQFDGVVNPPKDLTSDFHFKDSEKTRAFVRRNNEKNRYIRRDDKNPYYGFYSDFKPYDIFSDD